VNQNHRILNSNLCVNVHGQVHVSLSNVTIIRWN